MKITCQYSLVVILLFGVIKPIYGEQSSQPTSSSTANISNIHLVISTWNNCILADLWNMSNEPLRLWSFRNSEGYKSFALYVRDVKSKKVYAIHRKQTAWTVNPIVYHSIKQGGVERISIDLRDGSWDIPEALLQSINIDYEIRLIWNTEMTYLTKKLSIFTGTTISEWILVKGDHLWSKRVPAQRDFGNRDTMKEPASSGDCASPARLDNRREGERVPAE